MTEQLLAGQQRCIVFPGFLGLLSRLTDPNILIEENAGKGVAIAGAGLGGLAFGLSLLKCATKGGSYLSRVSECSTVTVAHLPERARAILSLYAATLVGCRCDSAFCNLAVLISGRTVDTSCITHPEPLQHSSRELEVLCPLANNKRYLISVPHQNCLSEQPNRAAYMVGILTIACCTRHNRTT